MVPSPPSTSKKGKALKTNFINRQALKAVFLLAHEDRTPRNVFIFSDGQPTNQDQITELIRESAAHTRVFTFGFGSDCSRHVVRTMARVGGGMAEFMPANKLPTISKIERQFRYFP